MKGPRSRRLLGGMIGAIVVVLGLVVLLAQWGGPGRPSGALADPVPRLDIDAVPGNGARPCDPIDSAAAVDVGSTYTVAVCIGDYTPAQLEAFELVITYDGTLDSGPEVADVAPALDDNPDANDGAGPDKLGTGWDCTALGFTYPTMNDASYVPAPAPPLKLAHIVCNANIVSPDKELADSPGLLATMTLNATAAGVDTLVFQPHTGISVTGVGSFDCGETQPAMTCTGATITIGGGGGVTPPAAPTTTPVAPTATPGTGPVANPTPLPPGMEAEPLAAGCNPVTSTYADGTPAQTIAAAVGPAGSLTSLWKFDASAWRGYSPQFPEASDLGAADFLDVVFICVGGPGDFVRPAV
jgi:hypothetical protein